MTNEISSDRPRSFAMTALLPWAVAGVVFVLYALTANFSLPTVLDWTTFLQQPPIPVRYAGYTYAPEFLLPVYYVVTTPLRWLPAASIPAALSLFSAACGALALGQLARAIQLLPHDRTRVQRERELNRHGQLTFPFAWLPAVIAPIIGALGLSMWEHGTNATPEMFDLLLFTYVLRTLLEYRVDQKDSRLYRAALVYGAAMTNNLAMIGFFPLFLVALVWTRKLAFFNLKFLARMAGCGLAGLLFYLVLPVISTFSEGHSFGFWEILSNNIMGQFWLLRGFPRQTLLLLSLTSLVPVFLMSIKWAGHSGDATQISNLITSIAFHLCHAVILIACLWVSLDPEFSPRVVGSRLWGGSGLSLAFLPLYLLAALNIGYYSGYLLLIFRPALERFRAAPPTPGLLAYALSALVLLALAATVAIQLHRNLPQVRISNGPLQSQFAAHLTGNLPDRGVIISDDPYHLFLLEHTLAQTGSGAGKTLLGSPWLPSPDYHQYLKQRYPDWDAPKLAPEQTEFFPNDLVRMLKQLERSNTVSYLHPSFGYYFESFVAMPAGLTFTLVRPQTNSLINPPLPVEVLGKNREFWATTGETLNRTLAPHIPQREETPEKMKFPASFYHKIGLRPHRNWFAQRLGALYSRSLVSWGVELQRANDYELAAAQFRLAKVLNPRNVVAEINLAFNEKFRSGVEITAELDRPRDEYFGESRTWDQLLNRYGPYDAPGIAIEQGYLYLQGNLLRQAATSFDRARQQAPNDVTSRLLLGQLHLTENLPDQTIRMVDEIRQIITRVPGLQTNLTDLFTLEAAAYLVKGQDETAQTIIDSNLAKAPDDFTLLASSCKAYADNRRYPKALALTERMIKVQPENVAAWINRGCFQVELTNYAGAIESFTTAMNLQTNNYRAQFYRAIAALRADNFGTAQQDYEAVQRQFPKEPGIFFGLGEIAYRRHDTNAAILNYEGYLANAPTNTPEAKVVSTRLNELQGITPPTTNAAAPTSK
jgi:tetratricopeptide (TPR) repeat protein